MRPHYWRSSKLPSVPQRPQHPLLLAEEADEAVEAGERRWVPQIELTELDAVGDTTPKFFTAAQFAALRKLSGILCRR